MLTTVDHPALVVRDLDASTARYSALLGCSPNWRGVDEGAEHTWFQLNNMALALFAPTGSGDAGDRVHARWEQGQGIWALAFATLDMARMRHISDVRAGRKPGSRLYDSHHPRMFRRSFLARNG